MPNFVAPSIAELARGEKSHSQSLTHSKQSPSLFDVPGTEAFASEQLCISTFY